MKKIKLILSVLIAFTLVSCSKDNEENINIDDYFEVIEFKNIPYGMYGQILYVDENYIYSYLIRENENNFDLVKFDKDGNKQLVFNDHTKIEDLDILDLVLLNEHIYYVTNSKVNDNNKQSVFLFDGNEHKELYENDKEMTNLNIKVLGNKVYLFSTFIENDDHHLEVLDLTNDANLIFSDHQTFDADTYQNLIAQVPEHKADRLYFSFAEKTFELKNDEVTNILDTDFINIIPINNSLLIGDIVDDKYILKDSLNGKSYSIDEEFLIPLIVTKEFTLVQAQSIEKTKILTLKYDENSLSVEDIYTFDNTNFAQALNDGIYIVNEHINDQTDLTSVVYLKYK